ncbi:MAG TPA: GerMN domain-containing protein [Anaerovoracaceae bacterium]|nr:GerMN domain-containing protein [Anaerovoracaceae bacterium]
MRNQGDTKESIKLSDPVNALRYMKVFALLLLLLLLIVTAGCSAQDTVTFTAEIEEVTDNSILVTTVDFEEFDKASVGLGEAKYDFEPAVGQIVEITIRPEIRESYPVQVTAVKLVLVGEAEKSIADYFPLMENVKYVYEGKGNEFASYTVYTDYITGNKAQQRVENGGTVSAHVYEVENGKVTLLQAKGEGYYRENMIAQAEGPGEVRLMEPLEKGTTWTLDDGSERTITGTETEVKTPAGTFTCIEVLTESSDGVTIDYYARNIGLVKTIFQSGGMEVSSTLKSMENDAARTEKIRFYYPDIEIEKIEYQIKEVTWHTNDDTALVLEEAYKAAADENFGTVLTTGAAINSLRLDEENRVRLDMNAAFAAEINAGIAYETMILQCIADTFGHYYNSNEVILTVEGKPYESGHIMMEEGESIRVDPDDLADEG